MMWTFYTTCPKCGHLLPGTNAAYCARCGWSNYNQIWTYPSTSPDSTKIDFDAILKSLDKKEQPQMNFIVNNPTINQDILKPGVCLTVTLYDGKEHNVLVVETSPYEIKVAFPDANAEEKVSTLDITVEELTDTSNKVAIVKVLA